MLICNATDEDRWVPALDAWVPAGASVEVDDAVLAAALCDQPDVWQPADPVVEDKLVEVPAPDDIEEND